MRKRAPLIALVFILIFPLQALSDDTMASNTDGPETRSAGPFSLSDIDLEDAEKGYTIIAPHGSTTVRLVDHEGETVHTWSSDRRTTGTVELLPNGTLMRARSGVNGGPSGMHLLAWDGKVIWDYSPPDPYNLHHDIDIMPNGNFLVNVGTYVTNDDAIAMGRDPNITVDGIPSEPVWEIKPWGKSQGIIVWEWDPLDHIIQDYNENLPNYGVVRDHPELIDLNYPEKNIPEWTHSNSVAYNAELDQVMITDRNFGEFWIIDHNTTTAEAAGHTGGARGKGGDILYRWGNPRAYGAGDTSHQKLWGPHDAHWIQSGYPGYNILLLNNGDGVTARRPDGNYSTVEEMTLPVNSTGGYDLAPGNIHYPPRPVWFYKASNPSSFFAWAMGGADRLPTGNTLVSSGSDGDNFEVDPNGTVVWSFKSQATFKNSRSYPPFLKMPNVLNATEDVPLSLDLSPYLFDLDTDREALKLGVDSRYGEVKGNVLTLLYPDGVQIDTVGVRVSDGIFNSVLDIQVRIEPVNDPPVITEIPEITVTEDVPYFVDLGTHVEDPDTNIVRMHVTTTSPYVQVDAGRLRLLYPDGILTDRFELMVSDGEFEARTWVSVAVIPVNDPPAFDPIPDQEGVEEVPWTIDLAPYVRDVDSTMDSLSMTSDSRYTMVTGLTLSLLYPEGVTEDVVSLTFSDGEADSTISFNVTITPVDDPPSVNGVRFVHVTEDVPSTLDLTETIEDVDTPLDELTLEADSPYVQVDGLSLLITYPDGIFMDEVVVGVSDAHTTTKVTLVVTVEPVNDPPEMRAPDVVRVTEDVPLVLDLGPHIIDTDTPAVGLVLAVDSPFIRVEGHLLRIQYPDGILHDEVSITLRDGEHRVSTTLEIDVEPVDDPPIWAVVPNIEATEEVEGELDLVPYMSDVDTPPDALEVLVVSDYGSLDGWTFRFLYPEGVHREDVTFTLSDGVSTVTVTVTVLVTPVNDPPELSEARVDTLRDSTGSMYVFSVVLRDVDLGMQTPVVRVVIDGVPHRCVRASGDARPYSEGATFLLEKELGAGEHTFHFEAEDGDGGSATTEVVTLTVEDDGTVFNSTLLLVLAIVAVGAVLLVAGLRQSRRRQ